MAQVFLSYTSDDVGRAKALAAAIERAGFTVWWDRELIGGAEYSREIEDALKAAEVVVVLWSKNSVDSAWVRDEAAVGRDTGRLVPVRLDASEPPLGFRQYQTIDLSRWNGRSDSAALTTLKNAIAAKTRTNTESRRTLQEAIPIAARSRTLPRAIWIAGLLIAITAAGGYFWDSRHAGHERPSIAIVGETDATDHQASNALAHTLSVEIGSLQTATTDQFNLQDTDAGSGADADYVVKVSAPHSSQTVGANLTLLAQHTRQILWTGHFEQQAGDQSSLRLQASTRLAAVLACLMEANAPGGRQLDQPTLKVYLRACEKSGDEYGEMADEGRLRLFQQVVDRYPQFAPALGHLAVLEANAGLTVAARRHLAAARKIDSKLGTIYLAERNLFPRSAWRQRQGALERGLEMTPDDAELHSGLAFDYSQVGRMTDAVAQSRRAVELDPLSPATRAENVQFLGRAGRIHEAEQALLEAEKIWPSSKLVGDARYAFDLRLGDPKRALRLLQEKQSLTPNPGIEAFIHARIDPTPANVEKAVSAYMALFRQDPADGDAMLLALGGLDRTGVAYEIVANLEFIKALREGTEILFRPYMRGIRHAPRFMQLAARLGLVGYWTETGKWPDFCLDSDLPYDCKREATKYR
ncbi:MAG: TIR domain-containing protein [Sphingomicrobium sp.]